MTRGRENVLQARGGGREALNDDHDDDHDYDDDGDGVRYAFSFCGDGREEGCKLPPIRWRLPFGGCAFRN